MGDPGVISHFDAFEGPNEYAFLSNFYVGQPLRFRGLPFASGEHLFQAFKARTTADREAVRTCATPAEAKQQGKHTLRLRPDWERVKYDAMRLVLAVKFARAREEGPLLLATGDALLVEGTMWGDRVWGVDLKAGRKAFEERADAADGPALSTAWAGPAWDPGAPWGESPGRNWLGVLLMARRAELYAEIRGFGKVDTTELFKFVTDVPKPS